MACLPAISDEFNAMLEDYRDSQGLEATPDLLRKLDEVQLFQLIDAARKAPEFRSFQKFNAVNPPQDAPHYAAMFGVGSDEERLENVIAFRLWQAACKRVLACREQMLQQAKVKIEPGEEPARTRQPRAQASKPQPQPIEQKKVHEFEQVAPQVQPVPPEPVPKASAPAEPAASPPPSSPAGMIDAQQAQALILALQQMVAGGAQQPSTDRGLQLVAQALQTAFRPSTAGSTTEGLPAKAEEPVEPKSDPPLQKEPMPEAPPRPGFVLQGTPKGFAQRCAPWRGLNAKVS